MLIKQSVTIIEDFVIDVNIEIAAINGCGLGFGLLIFILRIVINNLLRQFSGLHVNKGNYYLNVP
jgi:hypothetical protein